MMSILCVFRQACNLWWTVVQENVSMDKVATQDQKGGFDGQILSTSL
jgi:hypothetical protein